MAGSEELSRLMKYASRLSKHWAPTISIYAAATVLVGLYVTDWKVINTKIPYYSKKFDEESNI